MFIKYEKIKDMNKENNLIKRMYEFLTYLSRPPISLQCTGETFNPPPEAKAVTCDLLSKEAAFRTSCSVILPALPSKSRHDET